MSLALPTGSYVAINKAFPDLVLDLGGFRPAPEAQIVTFPANGQPNQNWVVKRNGTQVTFEAFGPSSFMFAPAEIPNEILRGSPGLKTGFIDVQPGQEGEYQFKAGEDTLAMQASGFNQPVRLQPADAGNAAQIWIMNRLD